MSFVVGETAEVCPGADAADADDGSDHPEQVDREERQRVAMLVLQGGAGCCSTCPTRMMARIQQTI